MRGSWFRLYDEVVDDSKVQSLPGEDFKLWINILCLANRNEGRLPELNALAFGLRISVEQAESVVDRFLIAGLIEKVKGGPIGWGIAPHSWAKRQYKSDTSTNRVKRFRSVSGNDIETPSEADTEAEIREDSSLRSESVIETPARRVARRSQEGELRKAFEQFWSLYPRRVSKIRALEVWLREIRLEFVPDVTQAALRYAETRVGEDDRYTLHAATWLRNGRWRDSLTDEKPKPPTNGNGNGKPTVSERNRASRAGLFAAFGGVAPDADSGPRGRSLELRGPDDPAGRG